MGRPCNCKNNNMHEDLKYAGFVAADHFSSIHLPLTLTIWGQLISTASLFVKLTKPTSLQIADLGAGLPFSLPCHETIFILVSYQHSLGVGHSIPPPATIRSPDGSTAQHGTYIPTGNRPHSLHCLVSGSWRWISCLHPPGPPPTNSKCPWKANRVGHFTGAHAKWMQCC